MRFDGQVGCWADIHRTDIVPVVLHTCQVMVSRIVTVVYIAYAGKEGIQAHESTQGYEFGLSPAPRITL